MWLFCALSAFFSFFWVWLGLVGTSGCLQDIVDVSCGVLVTGRRSGCVSVLCALRSSFLQFLRARWLFGRPDDRRDRISGGLSSWVDVGAGASVVVFFIEYSFFLWYFYGPRLSLDVRWTLKTCGMEFFVFSCDGPQETRTWSRGFWPLSLLFSLFLRLSTWHPRCVRSGALLLVVQSRAMGTTLSLGVCLTLVTSPLFPRFFVFPLVSRTSKTFQWAYLPSR